MAGWFNFRRFLALLWLLAGVVLVGPRSCSRLPVPSLACQQQPAPSKPRPWVGFRPRSTGYLAYPLPRPAKVKRDSLGHVVHLKK
jgi:hypothetical protein